MYLLAIDTDKMTNTVCACVYMCSKEKSTYPTLSNFDIKLYGKQYHLFLVYKQSVANESN